MCCSAELIMATGQTRRAHLPQKRSLLLLLFEVQDLLRGGLVANISTGINLLRGDDLFFLCHCKESSLICTSCPCLANRDLHPPIHKNIFFQPLLHSGQTLLQRAVWILKLLTIVLSAVVFHILFQVFVL